MPFFSSRGSLKPIRPLGLRRISRRRKVGMKATPIALRRSPATPPSSFKRNPRTPPPPSSPPQSKKPDPAVRSATRRSLAPAFSVESEPSDHKWVPLGVDQSEISLPLTLPTGQTFRWRQSQKSPAEFTGVIGTRLLSLKHLPGDPLGQVAFLHHGGAPADAAAAVRNFLNLDTGISVVSLWRDFSAVDGRFFDLSSSLDGGVRVLRQDPVECLFQFLCSSNNNIKRIERMVNVLASYGDYLGTVDLVDFYQFPSVDRLADVSEEELRDAGFGYRLTLVLLFESFMGDISVEFGFSPGLSS